MKCNIASVNQNSKKIPDYKKKNRKNITNLLHKMYVSQTKKKLSFLGLNVGYNTKVNKNLPPVSNI